MFTDPAAYTSLSRSEEATAMEPVEEADPGIEMIKDAKERLAKLKASP